MPIWSFEEIEVCRNKFYDTLNIELVKELLNRWGAIPRYILQKANGEIDVVTNLSKKNMSFTVYKIMLSQYRNLPD